MRTRGLPPAASSPCARLLDPAAETPAARPTSARVRRCSRSTERAGRSPAPRHHDHPGVGRPRRRARARPGRHQRVGLLVRSVPRGDAPARRTRRERRVRVLGIDERDDAGAARAFAASRGATYPSLYDPDGTLLARLPMLPQSGVPSTLFLDRRGRVAARVVGPVDAHVLRRILRRLGGSAMTVPLTAATAGAGRAPHARRAGRLRRPDEAPDHRAAAPDHPAGDVPGPRRGAAARAGRRDPRRRHPLRRQRQRAELRGRRRHRREDAAHPTAAAGARRRDPRARRWCSASSSASCRPLPSGCWSTGGRPLLALAANVFYVVGYTMWLKPRTAQNIVWGGAAGCFPTLIGWTAVRGRARLATRGAVPRRLLLDPAALLGAGDALPRGLRRRRGADAARGGARARRRPADPGLRRRHGGDVAGAVAGRAHGPGLPVHRAGPRSPPGAGGRAAAPALRDSDELAVLRPMRLFHFSNLYLALLFVSVALVPFVR